MSTVGLSAVLENSKASGPLVLRVFERLLSLTCLPSLADHRGPVKKPGSGGQGTGRRVGKRGHRDDA
jgi:hypothetical protein